MKQKRSHNPVHQSLQAAALCRKNNESIALQHALAGFLNFETPLLLRCKERGWFVARAYLPLAILLDEPLFPSSLMGFYSPHSFVTRAGRLGREVTAPYHYLPAHSL